MKNTIKIIFISFILVQSCTDKSKKIETKTEVSAKPINVISYKDSATVAWKKMMNNDDQKFKNMISLLENISYIEGANSSEINKVKAETENVWKTRYDSSGMKAVIVDEFDQKTTELISKITQIANKTKGIEKYANCTSLQQEISIADNNTLLLDRAHYDKWAKEYNKLIFKEKNNNKSKTLPLFETLN